MAQNEAVGHQTGYELRLAFCEVRGLLSLSCPSSPGDASSPNRGMGRGGRKSDGDRQEIDGTVGWDRCNTYAIVFT